MEATGPETKAGELLLRARGTGQQFHLRAGSTGGELEALPRGEILRVTGRVVKGSEGNEQEIWLELVHVESDRPAP